MSEKNSLLFLLDRVNGKPIYDVEERPVPASEMPLEKASPTQPFPVQASATGSPNHDYGTTLPP